MKYCKMVERALEEVKIATGSVVYGATAVQGLIYMKTLSKVQILI